LLSMLMLSKPRRLIFSAKQVSQVNSGSSSVDDFRVTTELGKVIEFRSHRVNGILSATLRVQTGSNTYKYVKLFEAKFSPDPKFTKGQDDSSINGSVDTYYPAGTIVMPSLPTIQVSELRLASGPSNSMLITLPSHNSSLHTFTLYGVSQEDFVPEIEILAGTIKAIYENN